MTLDVIAYNEARLAKLAAVYGSMPAAVKLFPTSGTYTTPFDAYIDFMVVGGGPSGGITHGSGCVGGGGAGECAYYLGLFVPAGTVFTGSVGVGGAPVTRGAAGQTSGSVGTESSIVAASISFNLTAYPGQPGAVGNPFGIPGGYAGGAGGTGGAGVSTAGSIHYAGGPGGSANSAAFGVAGAGAVNVMGWSDPATRLVGGSLTNGSGGAGGAGVGGKGGEKNTATAASFSPGGGAGGPGDNALSAAATAGPNAAGLRTQASMTSLATPASFFLDYFGGGGYTTVAPGPGGGSSGDTLVNMRASGIFAGMGGAFNGSTAVTLPQAGYGGPGAGLHVTTGTGNSGRGGGGLIVMLLRRAPT